MIQIARSHKLVFDPRPTVIRQPGADLTGSFVLCDAHNDPAGDGTGGTQTVVHGDIDVGFAKAVTFWGFGHFGTTPAAAIQIKPVFLDSLRGSAPALTDLAAADPWTTITSVTGGFKSEHVGRYLHVASGTNFTPGIYRITAVNSGTSITVDRAAGSTGAASGGAGTVQTEFGPHLAGSAPPRTVAPDILQLNQGDGGNRSFCFTVDLPAAQYLRVFAKATGTVTAADLMLGYTLVPPEA